MEKELTFNNHKIEKAVREALKLEDGPITTTLAKSVDFLCLLDCEISDSDFDTLRKRFRCHIKDTRQLTICFGLINRKGDLL